MRKILIGPAGHYHIGEKVLEKGADELYLGLKNWSLRSPCFEMTKSDITNLQSYAKKKNKVLRVCLNTYPWEHDLRSFDIEIEELVKIGIRAFVLADIANIKFIKRNYPGVSIQSSVACDTKNIDDVRVLEDAGATSVTLSLPNLNFVRLIKSTTDMDVVIFAHGYLNYTYRARCYMSSYLRHSYKVGSSGRENSSGSFNREGFCNRACKCHWSLLSDSSFAENVTMNSYPFVTIDKLTALLNAGADALKIQGRENSDNLVLDAVALYRTILDSYLEAPTDFTVTDEMKQKALHIDTLRHQEMKGRTVVMIKEMLGIDKSTTL